MGLHTYNSTTSNIAQVINAFASSNIFNGIEAVEIKAYANSANYSATLRATIIKRSATAFDIYLSEVTTTDETYIALPTLVYNATDDTLDLTQNTATSNDGSTDWLIVLDPDRTTLAPSGEVCTTTEIYDFAATENTLRTTAMTSVLTGLIDRATDEIEKFIGRIIIPTLYTITIHNGRYCQILDDKIYLNSKYFDIVSISSLAEDGTTLTENTDFVINSPNVIEKIDSTWSTTSLGIVITGYFGMGYLSGVNAYPHKAMKQIIIEACAVKAGLWSRMVSDGEGNSFDMVSRNLPKFTYDELKRFVQPVVI